MVSVNKVTILGNLGREPEIRKTGDGKSIANLNIATSENWKDRDGNKQEKTEWHRVVVFGKLADIVEKYLNKGDSVYIEGKLQTRKWQDSQGQDKYTTEISVDGFGGTLKMLGKRDSGGSQPAAEQPTMKPASSDAPFDDDVPF